VIAGAAIACAASVASTGHGGVAFTGFYMQNFNGLAQTGSTSIPNAGTPHAIEGVLGSTGMDGWSGYNYFGSSTSTEFRAQDGSQSGSAGRGINFFGTTGSSDRALGLLPTSNQVSAFGVVLTNTTGFTITELDVSFVGEQWRAGEPENVLTFSYGIGTSLSAAATPFSSLDFATLYSGENPQFAVDGNDPDNQVALSDTIGGLSVADGESIVLRWDMADMSGQDNGLAIDDLVVVGIPAPGAIALVGLAGQIGRRRR